MKNINSRKIIYPATVCCIALICTLVLFIAAEQQSAAPTTEFTENNTPSALQSEDKTVIPENTVTIGTAGDVLIHVPIYENAKNSDGNFDFSHIFTYAESTIRKCDYFIVNLETTFGGTDKRGYSVFPVSIRPML